MRFSLRLILTIPVLVYSIAIYIASSLQAPPTPNLGFDWQDKVFHAVAYCLYGFVLQFAVVAWRKEQQSHTWLTLIFALLFALSDEIHQYYVPWRTCDVFDWIADVFGVVISIWLFSFVRKKVEALRA